MECHVVEESEITSVASTLADAFFADPVWSWMIPDPSRRREQFIELWRLFISSAIIDGWVWSTSEASAVSVWNPPGIADLVEPYASDCDHLLDEVFGSGATRVRAALDAFDSNRPSSPDHFYLNMLGVADAHRGEGIGMTLLVANLKVIDGLGCPSYLESSNPANLVRYRDVGFEVHGAFDLPDGGPSVTTMWRPARS